MSACVIGPFHIEKYHFGFVVCDARGVALSKSFETETEAVEYMAKLQ